MISRAAKVGIICIFAPSTIIAIFWGSIRNVLESDEVKSQVQTLAAKLSETFPENRFVQSGREKFEEEIEKAKDLKDSAVAQAELMSDQSVSTMIKSGHEFDFEAIFSESLSLKESLNTLDRLLDLQETQPEHRDEIMKMYENCSASPAIADKVRKRCKEQAEQLRSIN